MLNTRYVCACVLSSDEEPLKLGIPEGTAESKPDSDEITPMKRHPGRNPQATSGDPSSTLNIEEAEEVGERDNDEGSEGPRSTLEGTCAEAVNKPKL